jgi:putative endonuclease
LHLKLIFKMFTTYILFSQITHKFYSGHCENLQVRVAQHNSGRNISTKSGIPWEIVFKQSFDSRKEAMNLESIIKKRGAKRFLMDFKKTLG